MEENDETMEKKFTGFDFQIFPRDYNKQGCPIFVLDNSMHGDLVGIPK